MHAFFFLHVNSYGMYGTENCSVRLAHNVKGGEECFSFFRLASAGKLAIVLLQRVRGKTDSHADLKRNNDGV